jgi:hypothetical protein
VTAPEIEQVRTRAQRVADTFECELRGTHPTRRPARAPLTPAAATAKVEHKAMCSRGAPPHA